MTLFELVAVGLLARGPFSKKNQGCRKMAESLLLLF